MNHIPASEHQLFQFFQRFFKVKADFPYRGKAFFNKSFVRLVKTDFLSSGNIIFDLFLFYFPIGGNHYWNQEKKVFKEKAYSYSWTTDFLAGGNHYFSYFSDTPTNVSFFPSSRKVFSNEILNFNQWKRILELITVSTNRGKKAVNKRIMFPVDKNSISTNQDEGLIKKILSHYAEKLLSPAEISKQTRRKQFPIVGERLLYKKWLHLNLNNGFHHHKICSK